MAKLRAPLKPWLDDPLDERDVQRIWRTLQARRHDGGMRARLPLAAAAVACALAVWWLAASLLAPAPGPLALAGERVLVPHGSLGADDAVRYGFSDGSRVLLEHGAQLEIVDNSGSKFSTRMRRGRGEFEVNPGGPRRWIVDCGLLDVEVVGTRFSIEREDQKVEVRVTRGVVIVRGPNVPGGMRRLGAGEALSVSAVGSANSPAAPALGAAGSRASPTPPSAAPQSSAQSARGASSSLTPADPKQQADARSQPAAADDAELARLLQEADAARRAQHVPRAEQLLEQVLQRSPRSAYAALAAITLGRMRMADKPLSAAASLRAALAADIPEDLREDTLVRLVEAYTRAGRPDLVQRAAADYRRSYPHGRRAAEVQGWIAQP
jgi:transmembrane sensor